RRSRSRPADLHRPHFSLVPALAAGTAATALIVGVALFTGGSTQAPVSPSGPHNNPGQSATGTLGIPSVPIGTDPLPGGRKVGLSGATRLLGSPVPPPNRELANDHTLSMIWAMRGEVMLDYVEP